MVLETFSTRFQGGVMIVSPKEQINASALTRLDIGITKGNQCRNCLSEIAPAIPIIMVDNPLAVTKIS
jgi:hypothetical protein